jgi:hypothetical protein
VDEVGAAAAFDEVVAAVAVDDLDAIPADDGVVSGRPPDRGNAGLISMVSPSSA